MQQLSAGQQALDGALGRLIALAESYPDPSRPTRP